MIVVDTNVIACLYLPTEFTAQSEIILQQEPDWIAPVLWKSELRNVLALYLRQQLLDLDSAIAIQAQAELLMSENEFEVNSEQVLALTERSGCSAYDCEFVALAQSFDLQLVTTDKKLIRAFPDVAIALPDFMD